MPSLKARIIVPRDCVDAFTEKDHVEGLEYLKKIYGAEIVDSSELISRLAKK